MLVILTEIQISPRLLPVDTQPPFGPNDVLTHIITDMAQAVSWRRDEPESRRLVRAQAAARTIVAFQPRDAIEAMLAGHCVMFHELIVDSVQTTLRGELDSTRRATRSGIVAMDKAFGANLLRLEQYRTRQATAAEPADIRTETEVADRVHRHQFGTASATARPDPVAAEANASSSSLIAPVSEPTSPSDVPHAAPRLAPLMDGDRPRDVHLATLEQMPGLNRQARRAIIRQARKRLDPGASTLATANRQGHP
jgi:hypothetical protein